MTQTPSADTLTTESNGNLRQQRGTGDYRHLTAAGLNFAFFRAILMMWHFGRRTIVRSLTVLAILALATLAAAAPAFAQGKAAQREAFCAKKPSASEREICIDRDLTRRDGYLNDAYQLLRQKLSKSDFIELRNEQRAWLRERNRCGSKTRCLAGKYEDRVAELEQMLENIDNPGKSHVEIGCDGERQLYVGGRCLTRAANVIGNNETVWQTYAYNDESNRGRYTAQLVFGIPETDAVAFTAICQAGSSGTFATTRMSYRTGDLKTGTSVKLQVFADGYEDTFDAEIYSPVSGEGVSGILLRPQYTDAFWNALEGNKRLDYAIEGRPATAISLKGSGPKVRRFIEDCKSIQAVLNQESGPGPLTAKNRTCDAWGKVKSKNSNTPVMVTFINRTDSLRSVMWIDFDGQPKEYASLDPGQSYTIKTFETHPWMFMDGPGNCIEMFMPKKGIKQFDITASSPWFGPEND